MTRRGMVGFLAVVFFAFAVSIGPMWAGYVDVHSVSLNGTGDTNAFQISSTDNNEQIYFVKVETIGDSVNVAPDTTVVDSNDWVIQAGESEKYPVKGNRRSFNISVMANGGDATTVYVEVSDDA